MVNIISASSNHIDWISQSLADYFAEQNKVYGFDKYKTDVAIMMKHVDKRINDQNSEYKYFVAVDENNQPMGFASILESRIPELTILKVNSNQDEKPVVNALMSYLVEYLRGKGFKQFISEISEIDKFTGAVLNSLDSRALETTYVTQI